MQVLRGPTFQGCIARYSSGRMIISVRDPSFRVVPMAKGAPRRKDRG